MDFFFGIDSFKNYFSEILGIFISILLIPVFIRIYENKKNRTLRFIFYDRIFSYISRLIESYLPPHFRQSYDLCKYSDRKKNYTLIPSYSLKDIDDEHLELEYIKALEKIKENDRIKFIKKLQNDFDQLESEINAWLTIYNKVTDDVIYKQIHKILYDLRSFKYKYGFYLDENVFVVVNYADYITTIIFELTKLYKVIWNRYPIEEKN